MTTYLTLIDDIIKKKNSEINILTSQLTDLASFNDKLKDNVKNLKDKNHSLEKRIDDAFSGFEKQMKIMIKRQKAKTKGGSSNFNEQSTSQVQKLDGNVIKKNGNFVGLHESSGMIFNTMNVGSPATRNFFPNENLLNKMEGGHYNIDLSQSKENFNPNMTQKSDFTDINYSDNLDRLHEKIVLLNKEKLILEQKNTKQLMKLQEMNSAMRESEKQMEVLQIEMEKVHGFPNHGSTYNLH